MELKHIDIAKLAVSDANMRGKGKADLSNILPSVRARGVLVPLIVRQNGSPDTYEIVAGKRRYQAALVVAQETGESEPRLRAAHRFRRDPFTTAIPGRNAR